MSSYLVLGAGRQGIAVSYFLAKYCKAKKIVVADKDPFQCVSGVGQIKKIIGESPAIIEASFVGDVSLKKYLRKILKPTDVLIAALPHQYVFETAAAAAEIGAGYCDYGFNSAIIRQQLELDKKAKETGARIVVNNGVGPGLNNIIAVGGSREFDCDAIKMFLGGIPENHKCNPIGYESSFANLLEEYVGAVTIVENGKLKQIPLPGGFEELNWPFHGTEAFFTDVGTSITAEIILSEGKIKNFWEKTIRWSGHYKLLRQLEFLGFFKKNKIEISKTRVSPFDISKLCFESLPKAKKDILALLVIFEKCSKEVAKVYMIVNYDPTTELTAMQIATSDPVALTAKMIAEGVIPPGAHLPEIIINKTIGWKKFISELEKIGLKVIVPPR